MLGPNFEALRLTEDLQGFPAARATSFEHLPALKERVEPWLAREQRITKAFLSLLMGLGAEDELRKAIDSMNAVEALPPEKSTVWLMQRISGVGQRKRSHGKGSQRYFLSEWYMFRYVKSPYRDLSAVYSSCLNALAQEHNYGKVHESATFREKLHVGFRLKQGLDAKWKAGHDALEAACTRLRDSLDKVGEDRLLCGGLSLLRRRRRS